MKLPCSGDIALRLEIEDMRLITRPAKPWQIEHKHGMVRAIAKYMCASPAVVKEALAAVDALRGTAADKEQKKCVVAVAAE